MKLTKRGKRVRAIFIVLAVMVGLYLIWQVDTHLWWSGDTPCWNSDPFKCY